MVTNEQLKPTTIPGSVNPQQTLTDVYVPSTFEDRFGELLNNPMPSNLGLRIPIDDFKTEYSDGSKFRGLFQKSGDKLKQDPNFDPITSRVITTPLSEVEPYLKYDSNYDNNFTAALGQAGKGAVVGGGVGSFFTPVAGTAIGAGVGATLGFFSGLLTSSGRGVYIPGRDNRQEMIEKQSGFWNTLGGFTNNFLDRSFEAGIGGTAALLTSPFGAIAGRDFYDWGSNPLTRKLSESLEQSEYKRHLSDNYLNKGPIAKFFTAEGFQNEIADMAGFTVGMMLGAKINMGLNAGTGQAVSKLAIGLKNPSLATSISNRGGNLIGDFLPTVAKRASALFTKGSTKLTAAQQAATFSELNLGTLAKNAFKKGTFEDYGKNLMNAFKNPAFGLKALSSFERTALASYGEGRVEAAQAYKDIYDTAIKNGYSASESAEMATKGANKTLLGNLAILGVTNQFGLNQLTNVSSIKNLSRWFSKDFTLDVTTSKILKEVLKDIGKNASKGAIVEGFAEELGQFAISQAAKNQQLNMANPLNPMHRAFLTEFIEAYKDGITSDEGISNWFGGALFGSVMGGFGPGGILSTINEANKAKNINIPDSLKTKISNFSSAIDFISKHTVPFNGQLFQSYREENGEYIPDNNGNVRLVNDPTRLIKLTQALNHVNTLSKDQANLILTNIKNNIKTEDPAMQEGFKIIKDYLDLFGETGEKSLEQYINQDLSTKEKQNTLYLLSKLGENVVEQGYAQDLDISNIAKSMVSSSYVFDHVVNGIEDKIFDELDALEASLLNPTSESGQKDLIEFFGQNYKLDQLDQAKEDIKTFRDQLKKQVKIFKGLANRYSEPFTYINIKKGNKVHKLPITVDMYSVFRSALVQDDLNNMLSEIDEKSESIKSELLLDPKYAKEYLNPNNTSEDVMDLAEQDGDNPLYLQYKALEGFKKQVNDSLQKENKAFEELTNVKKLIEKAQKSEKSINSEIEKPTTSSDIPKTEPLVILETPEIIPEDNPEELDLTPKVENINPEVEELEQQSTTSNQSETPEVPEIVSQEDPASKERDRVSTNEPIEYSDADNDNMSLDDEEYRSDASKTPLSQITIFKTYGADFRNGKIQANNIAKSYFYDQILDLTQDHYFLPIPINSTLGLSIIKDKEGDFYKDYQFTPSDLLYLLISLDENNNPIVYNLPTGKTVPEKILLADILANKNIPSGLIYDKSSTFPIENINNKFSQTEKYSTEEINTIYQNYILGLNQMFSDSAELINEYDKDDIDINKLKFNIFNNLKPVIGITPGVQDGRVSKVKYEKISEDYDIYIPTLESAVDTKYHELKLGTVYAYKNGKYIKTSRRKFNRNEATILANLIKKQLSGEFLEIDEEIYLKGVLNWFDDLTTSNAYNKNSVGIINDQFIAAPYFGNNNNPKLGFTWTIDSSIDSLINFFTTSYPHISKSKLDNSVQFFQDKETNKVYNTYEEYLRDRDIITIPAAINDRLPVKSNRQLIFDPLFGLKDIQTADEKNVYRTARIKLNKDNFTDPMSVQHFFTNNLSQVTPSEEKNGNKIYYFNNIFLSIKGPNDNLLVGNLSKYFDNDVWNNTSINGAQITQDEFGQDIVPIGIKFNLMVTIDSNNDVIINIEKLKNNEREETPKIDESSEIENPNNTVDINPTEEISNEEEDDIYEDSDETPYRLFTDSSEIENIEEFKSWLSEFLPQFSIQTTPDAIKGIAQGALIGSFITLWKNAGFGTGYHEAFEAVWAYFIPTDIKTKLINEFKSKEGVYKNPFTKKTVKYSDSNDHDAKEMLAEGFIDFMKNRKLKPQSPVQNNFFLRLLDLLKRLFSNISKIFNKSEKEAINTINDVYEKLASGKYSDEIITDYNVGIQFRQRFAASDIDLNHVNIFNSILYDRVMSNLGFSNIYDIIDNNIENDTTTKELIGSLLKEQGDSLLNELQKEFKSKKVKGFSFFDDNFEFKTQELKKGLLENATQVFLQKSKLDEFVSIDNLDEMEVSSKEGIVPTNEINPTSNVNNVTRFLLNNLKYHYINEVGLLKPAVVNTYFGKNKDITLTIFKKPSFSVIQTFLLNKLANTVSYYKEGVEVSLFDAMMEKLTPFENKETWIKDLKNKLGVGHSSLSDNIIKMRLAFVTSFKNAEYEPIVLRSSENAVYIENPVFESSQTSLLENWISTVQDKALYKSSINIVMDTTLNKAKVVYPEINLTNEYQVQEYFKDILGVDIGRPKIGTDIYESVRTILSIIKNRGSVVFDDLVKDIAGSSFRTLAKHIALKDSTSSKSYKNSDGKSEFSIINPTFISDIINVYNSVDNYNDFLLSYPHLHNNFELKLGLKNNYFLKKGGFLFDINGFKYKDSKISLKLLSGIQDKTNSKGFSFSKMPLEDKLAFKATAALSGNYSLLLNSDKNMENSLSFNNRYLIKSVNLNPQFFSKEYNSGTSINAEAVRIIEDYFIPQLQDEIDTLFSKDGLNVQFLKDKINKKQLGYYQDIVNFSIDDFEKIKSDYDSDKSKLYDYLKSSIPLIYTYLRNQIENDYKNLYKSGFFKNIDGKLLMSRNILNSQDIKFINNALNDFFNSKNLYGKERDKFIQSITGKNQNPDVASGRLVSFFFKKIDEIYMIYAQAGYKDVTSNNLDYLFRKVAINISLNYELYNKDIQGFLYGPYSAYKNGDFGKRAGFLASSKQSQDNSLSLNNHLNLTSKRLDRKNRDGLLSFVSYKDPIVVSARITSIAEDFYKVLKNDKHSHDQIEKLVGAKFKKDGTLKEIIAESGTLLAPYEELKLADAQAYIMLDTFHDLMYKSGKLTRSQKVHINYEMALERVERSELPKTDPAYKPLSGKQKARDLAYLNDPKIKKEANSAVLQVLKPQGSGFNQNNLDVSVPIFLKNSVVPLSWSRVKNNPILRNKYVIWQKNQVDLIGFESGQKIGVVLKDGQSTPLYTVDGINNDIPFIQKMKFNDFGIQQETPNEFKTSVNRGVQITKLIVGNLSHHFKNKPHIKELVDEYYLNLNELYQRGYDDLMKKLGLREEGNYYVTDNLSNLVETLSEQATLLKLPINIKDMFVIDKSTGKLPYKFDASTERHRIEYILNSILDKTLIHQKVKGTQAPQVSSVFEQSNLKPLFKRKGIWTEYSKGMKLTADEEKSIRYSSTDLKILSDGTIEVMLPSYLKGMVNLNTSKIDPELLELVGYRIPTQSLGQVEKIKVVGFLNQSYGDAIIVPSELVGKAGSDFDIDKLNLYFPHYYKDKQGNYRYVNYSTSEEELGLRYHNYIKSNEEILFKKLKKDIFDAIKERSIELNINLNKEDLAQFFTKKTFKKLPDVIQEEYFELQKGLRNSESKILEKTIAHIQKTLDLINEFEDASKNNEAIEFENSDGIIALTPTDILPLLYNLQDEYNRLLNAAGYNQDQIELIHEKLKEFNEYKTDLLTTELPNIVHDIARDYGYMSIEQFAQLPIVKQNSLESLENKNLELMKRIISLPENRLQHLAPNSAANIEAMDKIINSSEVKQKSYHISTFYGSTEFRNIMVSAKNLVGAGALHITGHQITQMFDVSFSNPDIFQYLPFIDTVNLNKVYDNKGRLISSNLSEFLSAFVDAAKDPFAVRLNLNNVTINVALMLIRLGVSIEETLYFLNQPSIKNYVKRFNNVTSLLRKSSNDSQNKSMAYAYALWETTKNLDGVDSLASRQFIFEAEKINNNTEDDIYLNEEKKPKYVNLTDKVIETIFNYGTFEEISRLSNIIINALSLAEIHTEEGKQNFIKNLENSLTKPTSKEIRYQTAISSLSMFINLMRPAQDLASLNTATNIESKKTKTLIENESLLKNVNNFLFSLNPKFTNMNSIFNRSHLSTVYANRMNFNKYLEPYLMVANPNFSHLLNSIANDGYISLAYGQAKNDLVYKFNTFLLSYLVQNNPNFRPTGDEEVMFKSLAGRIKAIQENEHYKPFKSHNLFNNISYTLRGQYQGDLKTHIRLAKYREDDVIDRDVEIQKHENAYELALSRMKTSRLESKKDFYKELVSIYEDLVDYSILQSGLSSQYTSLAGVLPADLFAKKVSKYLDQSSKNINLTDLWDIFVRNNNRNSLLVDIKPEVIKNSNIIDYNGVTYYRVYSNNPYIKRNIVETVESEDLFSDGDDKLQMKFLRIIPKEERKGILEDLGYKDSNYWNLYEEVSTLGDNQWFLETKNIYDSLSSRPPAYIKEDYSLPEETEISETIQLSQIQTDIYNFYKKLYSENEEVREMFYIFADNYGISFFDANSLIKTLILDYESEIQKSVQQIINSKLC
jgi:hypothetical protein